MWELIADGIRKIGEYLAEKQSPAQTPQSPPKKVVMLPFELENDPNIEYAMHGDSAAAVGFRPYADKSRAVINGLARSVGDRAFEECAELTTVKIREGVTEIGFHAFYDCPRLADVKLPRGLKKIGGWSFRDCPALTHIDIPDTVTEICFCAFWSSGLQTLTLPESVRRVDMSAFSICKSLTDLTLNEGLKELGTSAFECTYSLGYVALPDSLTVLEERAFRNSGLMGVNIPPQISELKDETFRDCKRLTEISVPDNITKIGERVFMGCEELRTVRLPRGAEIDDSVFEGCSRLHSFTVGSFTVIIPASVGADKTGRFMSFLTRRLGSGVWGEDNSFEERQYGRDAMFALAFQLWEYGFAGVEEYLTRDIALSIDRAVCLDFPAAFDKLTALGGRIDPERMDEYIARSIDRGERELYLTLIRYKRDILGFDTDIGIEERFEL